MGYSFKKGHQFVQLSGLGYFVTGPETVDSEQLRSIGSNAEIVADRNC